MSSTKYYDGSYPNDEVLKYYEEAYEERTWMERFEEDAPQIEGLPTFLDVPGHRLTVVTRDEWGALPPLATETLEHPVNSVVFAYNTGMPPCNSQEECSNAMREMQKKHMGLGLSDIHYNFCIGGDAAMYEGRGWFTKHAKSQHYPKVYETTFVIGVIGDGKCDQSWKKEFEIVAPGMRLVRVGVRKNYIVEIHSVTEDHDKIASCTMPGC